MKLIWNTLLITFSIMIAPILTTAQEPSQPTDSDLEFLNDEGIEAFVFAIEELGLQDVTIFELALIATNSSLDSPELLSIGSLTLGTVVTAYRAGRQEHGHVYAGPIKRIRDAIRFIRKHSDDIWDWISRMFKGVKDVGKCHAIVFGVIVECLIDGNSLNECKRRALLFGGSHPACTPVRGGRPGTY